MNVSRYRCSTLVVDDDPGVLAVLAAQLGGEFDVVTACTADQARGVFAARAVDILLTDLHLPDETGLQLLDWVRRTSPRTARVLISGTARLEDAVDAINHTQVHRLVLKPWRAEDLLQTLRASARTLLLERSHEQLLDDMRKLNLDLERRIQERTREVEQTNTRLRQQTEILREMALTDSLTGLPNRRAIDVLARKELMRRTRVPAPLAIGLVDVDHFKDINTVHLWSGGDHVLVHLAGVLQGSIRAADSLGRAGGEEFMVVAPNTDVAGAEVLAERLRSTVEAAATGFGGKPITLTVSVGFAVAGADDPAGYGVIREAAERALKAAKEGGRNRWVVTTVGAPAG